MLETHGSFIRRSVSLIMRLGRAMAGAGVKRRRGVEAKRSNVLLAVEGQGQVRMATAIAASSCFL